ncbi:hypothetical protein Cmtc_60310 [Cupriavidus sp. TKC]|nr:hypothetical protein Cmtc_60310 [Cupriavidus sp. TKC]
MDIHHSCPSCEGKKRVSGFVTDSTGRLRLTRTAPCPQCDGVGTITDEQCRWIAIGRSHRQMRFAHKESAVAAALRLGLSVDQLTAAELGRLPPAILALPGSPPGQSPI